MRIVLFQNNLKNRLTHHYLEAFAWKQACRKKRIPLLIFAHKDLEDNIGKELAAQPCFQYETDCRFIKDPHLNELHRFITVSQSFCNSLLSIESKLLPNDTLIVPYASEVEMYGISLWLNRSSLQSQFNKIIFISHTPNLTWKINQRGQVIEGNLVYHQYVALNLKEHITQKKILFFSTNNNLSNLLSTLLKANVETCPISIDYYNPSEVSGSDMDPTGVPAHIGIMGQIRPEKGQNIFPQVLKNYCLQRPKRNVFIQMSSPQDAQNIERHLCELPTKQVVGYIGEFSQRAYLEQMKKLDILLLPYSPERYKYRASGIFAEAVAYGLVCVVPNDSWMSDQLKSGWGAGVVFKDYTTEDITKALLTASDRIIELKVRANSNTQEWKDTQSTRALLDFILTKAAITP